jgi:hypothetical protein
VELGPQTKFVVFFSVAIGTPDSLRLGTGSMLGYGLRLPIEQGRARTPRRPSSPAAAQMNTAIPIDPAMITYTSGELL